MAWRKPQEIPRQEAPEWYRVFHPEAWDEPDAHEQAMIDGCNGYRCWPGSPEWRPEEYPGWPQFIHDQHARRRWAEAKGKYRDQHPLLATQEFNEIRAARAVRRPLP